MMLVQVTITLIIYRLFLMHCLFLCIINCIHCIKIFIYKDTLNNYGEKDLQENICRGNEVFNHFNVYIKTHCITNT